MNDSSFVRGAARLVICESVIGDQIDSIGDIIVLDECERQYDVRPGMYDYGVSKSGFQIVHEAEEEFFDVDMFRGGIAKIPVYYQKLVRTQIAGQYPQSIMDHWMKIAGRDGSATLIFMVQNAQGKIRAYVFECSQIQPIDLPLDFGWKGEATAVPASWRFQNGKILEQLHREPQSNLNPGQAASDFDAWLKSL